MAIGQVELVVLSLQDLESLVLREFHLRLFDHVQEGFATPRETQKLVRLLQVRLDLGLVSPDVAKLSQKQSAAKQT